MKKKCICCGIEKDISEYYSHPRTADGHLNKCKECCKKQNKDNREKHLEYYREYDRNRKANQNNYEKGKQMKVYLSGAITGVKHADKLFARAEEKLELLGYEVVNPYKFGEYLKKEYAKENKVPKYENYMRGDIELLINCDAIYLLENWGTSKGARLEKKIAEVLKMQIMTE